MDLGPTWRSYPKRSIQDVRRSDEYHGSTPEPNYSEFGRIGAEYVDALGREYILADGPLRDAYVNSGDQDPDFRRPDPRGTRTVGTVVFWVRLPVRLRGAVGFPEPTRDRLAMYFFSEQIPCEGFTDGVFFSGPKKKTGWAVVRDFVTFGRLANPSAAERRFLGGETPSRSKAQ